MRLLNKTPLYKPFFVTHQSSTERPEVAANGEEMFPVQNIRHHTLIVPLKTNISGCCKKLCQGNYDKSTLAYIRFFDNYVTQSLRGVGGRRES